MAVITPGQSGRVRRSQSIYVMPPRTLKAPVGEWFSCLTQTSHLARARQSDFPVNLTIFHKSDDTSHTSLHTNIHIFLFGTLPPQRRQ